MNKFGVLANYKRTDGTVEHEIISWLKAEGAEVVTPDYEYDVVDQDFLFSFLSKEGKNCECLIVLGGDGTLLSVARQAANFSVPIFGVNMGHVGFLAEVEPDDHLYPSLRRLLNDDFVKEERMMLKVKVFRSGELHQEYHCLNDCILTKQSFDGLVHVDAFVDDKPSLSYNGDGLVVATPTGASGYSLSAGGPLVSPEMEAMILTPASAHNLYSRTIVIDAKREIMLKASREEGTCVLYVDGKTSVLELVPEDRIRISKSDLTTCFIRMNDKSFFHVLNEKLRERS
ncbi:MAG: NAD(+)/NADH kinase [Firmicutes bacterium]|nr:NAD(+)/NADH kinase [Bacillota bacterium]